MLRREFLVGSAALALAGCSGSDTGVTIGNLIDEIKKQCAFAPELDAIIKVVTTLVTGFNAQAGAAAIIATAVAKQIIEMVCNAVKAQLAQAQVEKKAMPNKITIVVNNVPVEGTYGT